jgi:hypothetical protein
MKSYSLTKIVVNVALCASLLATGCRAQWIVVRLAGFASVDPDGVEHCDAGLHSAIRPVTRSGASNRRSKYF